MRRFLPGFVKRGLKAVGLRVVDRLREWTRPNNHSLVSGAVADATRSKSELMLENALLRQQVIVLDRQVKRPVLSWRERGIMVVLASQLRHWKSALIIVQPDTLLRWHRDLFRRVWRHKSQPKQQGGRRPLSGPIVQLIRRQAK
jgi:putative transposase